MSTASTRICVFCSTVSGRSPLHLEAARSLANALHAKDITLIYGGGTTGMMGELAKTLVALSGPDKVHGIIPKAYLSIERPQERVEDVANEERSRNGWLAKLLPGSKKKPVDEPALLSEDVYGRITVVGDVQIRKKMMANLVAKGGPGSGFIGLSGGFGTMDELMEMVTWKQLGVHNRGVCVLNVDGFWDPLMDWMERSIEAGFVREEGRSLLVAKGTAEECVQWLNEHDAGRS
jgi:uncharacterized protein (TIGR00730 family)